MPIIPFEKMRDALTEGFRTTEHYPSFSGFVNSGALWDFCIETLCDPISLSCIVFANDLGIPPVQSLLVFYEKAVRPDESFRFSERESQTLGALMGYLFRFVLNYEDLTRNVEVKKYGIHGASCFTNGPVWHFEEKI
ncbi:MAG: hypothetical protein WC966_11535 [Bradymonadales bacterium]